MSTSCSTSLTPKSDRVSASRPPRAPVQVPSPRQAQAKRQRSTCGEDRGALTPLGGRAASVALALMVLAGAAAPAVAQQVVYDPRNHAENVLQAARQLESLANEARLISQQARALAASPHAPLADAISSVEAIDALARSAKGLSADVEALERQFESLYPDRFDTADAESLARGRQDRLQAARTTAQDLARIAASIGQEAPARSRRLEGALAASRAAEGQTAAIQSSTWTLAVLAEELAGLRAVVLAQARLEAEAAAGQATERAVAAEARRRFWGRRAAAPSAPRFDPLPHARDQE